MVLQFRGREMSYRDNGMKKFRAIIERVEEYGAVVESEPKMVGTRIIAILASLKKPVKKPEGKPQKKQKQGEEPSKDGVNA